MKQPRSIFTTLLLGVTALLLACAGVSSIQAPVASQTGPDVSATLTALPPLPTVPLTPAVPPSAATFCPSSQDLAPIVGEIVNPGSATGTNLGVTSCEYINETTGDGGLFQLVAFADKQAAQRQYMSSMQDAQRVGQVQEVSGIGDAAFYFVGEAIIVLKGSYNLIVKFFYINASSGKGTGANEQVDIGIAQLLVSRL